jgi:uncharacterized protein
MRYTSLMTIPDPILLKFRAALNELYGDRIERVVLYGSRARGDAKPDSDYDIALFLKDLTDGFEEYCRIVPIKLAIQDETDADINTLPFPAGHWRDRTPLMHEIRKDGIDL